MSSDLGTMVADSIISLIMWCLIGGLVVGAGVVGLIWLAIKYL